MKLPRKLKKGFKHVYPLALKRRAGGQDILWVIEKEYRITKWVRKAAHKKAKLYDDYNRCRNDFDFWKEHYYGGMIPKQ